MSAWIVSQNHIRALVTGAVKFGVVPSEVAEKFGNVLTLANVLSVNYRYNERTEPETYTHEDVHLDSLSLLKQVRCYDYQTCEHPSWEKCETKKFLDSLEAKIVASLPMVDPFGSQMYRDAPWGV